MDEPSALERAERTFWTVWNYISGAVTRLMRSQPAGNNLGSVDREQTAGLEGADVDPSQRNEEGQEEEEEEDEEKKEEEEQSDLNSAFLPRSPVDLPPRNDTLLQESVRSRDVRCTSESTRWGGDHSRPEQGNAGGAQWLIQTEPPSIKPNAATQQTVKPEHHETLLGGRGETKTEESDTPHEQQETEVSDFSNEANDHKHSGRVKEIDETMAANRPEQEAGQDSKVTEEEKALPRDEDTDLNGPNNVSGLEREGLHIVTEETCGNEEHLGRRDGGGEGDAQDATSTSPENTDGGSAEPSTLPEGEDPLESHLESSEAAWETDLGGNVSDEDRDEEADQEIATTVSVTPLVESPEANLSNFRSNDDNAVGQERLVVEADPSVEEVQSELKEYRSDLIEGEVFGEGSETSGEEAREAVPAHVEETSPVHSRDRRDDSLLQEDVTQSEAEKEEEGEEREATEISETLQMAQDQEPSHSMNAEAEPEPRFGAGDTRSRESRESVSASSLEDGEDGRGQLSAQGAAGIDSPGGAVAGKAESNNEQEMSAALPDVSPGTAEGSGAGPGGLNGAAMEETRCLTPEVNNDRLAVSSGDTEQIGLMGRDFEESWVTSRSPRASEGFKYVAGEGERAQCQKREGRDATLRNWGTEDTAAGAEVAVGGSVDPESLGHIEVPWGSSQQSSGTAVQATGEEEEEEEEEKEEEEEEEEGSTGDGLLDEKHSGREAHKTNTEDFKTEEPLFDLTLDRERSESEEKVASQSVVRSSVWCDEVTAQDDHLLGEKTLVLPDAAIQTTTEVWDVESRAVAMTEDYKGRTPSRSEDHIEPQAPQSTAIDSTFSDDEETNMEDIDADVSDDAMGKGLSHAGSEDTTESSAESNQSLVDTVAAGSLTDTTSHLLMELRQDHPDGLEESTCRVTEPQTDTATREVEEHVEVVSVVKAAEDEWDLATGHATETDEEILALWVLPEDTDHTTSDTTAMVSQTGTSSASSSDCADANEPADHQPNSEEKIRDPDETKEMSGQSEGEEDKKLPLEAYPCHSGLSGTWRISDILEPQGQENPDHTSGRERLSEGEVTTQPEPVRLPEMLTEAHPGVPDASLQHSFPERRTPSPSEVSEVAASDDRAAEDGRDETSAIPVPTPDRVDEGCMKPGGEDPYHLRPEVKLSEPVVPAEVDSVVMREKKGFGASRQGLDSQHPLHKLLLINQAMSRRSEFIPSPVAGRSAEERARQRHSLPPGTSGDQFELDVSVLDLTAQKSRILVKNPITRRPTDPRALLERPSLEPSPQQPSGPQRAIRGLGPGIKLPGFGMGFPALKKTPKVVKEVEDVPEQESEPQPGVTMSPKPTVAQQKPRWTPPKQPGFGNPLMSELKSKLKKSSED